MISEEAFMKFASQLVAAQATHLMQALKSGDTPRDDLFDTAMRHFWYVCQPGIKCDTIDVTEGARQSFPDIREATLFVAHDTETGDVGVISITGTGGRPGSDDMSPTGGLATLARKVLVEELNLDPEKVDQALGREPITLGDVFRNQTKESIDKEVSKFREELDARIDSLFKGGGDSS